MQRLQAYKYQILPEGTGVGAVRDAGDLGHAPRHPSDGGADGLDPVRYPSLPGRERRHPDPGRQELDPVTIDQTLGILLKNQEDILAVRGERVADLLNRARAGRP